MAISSSQRSGIRGLAKLRRTLRRIEPEATVGLKKALRDGAEAIKRDAQALAPRDEGDLIAAIDATISRDGFTAVIGPGAKAVNAERAAGRAASRGKVVILSSANQELLFQFFKGLWFEFGTKGDPKRNVPPLAAQPFMGPAYDLNAAWIKNNARRELAKALQRAAAGGGGTNG